MHYLHKSGISSGFLPLNLPPSDGAPKPIAAAIDEYVALKEERRKLTAERAALAGQQPERASAEQDARLAAQGKPPKHRKELEAHRASTSHAIAGLQVRMDDTLLKLIEAIDKHGAKWIASLAAIKADAEARTAEALQVVEDQATRMVGAERLMSWVRRMPERSKWSGEIHPIPDELRTPISTLQRFIEGSIGVESIGIAKPLNVEAA